MNDVSTADDAFFAWTKTQPPKRWAKVNLHDCSIGWHARDDEIQRLRARVAELEKTMCFVRAYCEDVQLEGTANERAIAYVVSNMIAQQEPKP